jgi:hypothetical protein
MHNNLKLIKWKNGKGVWDFFASLSKKKDKMNDLVSHMFKWKFPSKIQFKVDFN